MNTTHSPLRIRSPWHRGGLDIARLARAPVQAMRSLRGPATGLVLAVIAAASGCSPAAPSLDQLGVPSRIGDWELSLTDNGDQYVEEVVEAFFAAAGGSEANSIHGSYRIKGPDVFRRLEGFRVIGATPAAMWAGAEDSIVPDSAERTSVPFAGWDVDRFDERGDNVPEPTWIAVQGDRLFAFSAMKREDVEVILTAIDPK